MSEKRRIEQAIVEYDTCDACGAEVRTGALIGPDEEKFDPRSRSPGFHPLILWPRHPWDRANLCSTCAKWSDAGGRHGYARLPVAGRDIPYDVPGMVRIAVYRLPSSWAGGDDPLQLSPYPPEPEHLRNYCSAIVRRGDRAVVLHERDGYWVPTATNVGRISDEWMRDLAHGERQIIVCEHTSDTPWPTVFEPTLPDGSWEAEEADPALWGQALCERAEDDNGICMLHPCSLRVPQEILV